MQKRFFNVLFLPAMLTICLSCCPIFSHSSSDLLFLFIMVCNALFVPSIAAASRKLTFSRRLSSPSRRSSSFILSVRERSFGFGIVNQNGIGACQRNSNRCESSQFVARRSDLEKILRNDFIYYVRQEFKTKRGNFLFAVFVIA